MREQTIVGMLVVAAALLVVVPAVGLATAGGAAPVAQGGETNETGTETAPGERLSGVTGVGEAELEGDLERRAFGLQIANASTEGAQADVVAQRVSSIEQRLAELEDRKAELDQQRESGEISDGKYRAEVAQLSARTETLRQLSNQSAAVSEQLPAELLEERGVNATRIQRLSERANELSGPEVAEIARGIAGPGAGEMPGGDRPVEVPDRPGDRPGEDRRGGGNQTDDRRGGGDRPGGDDRRGPNNQTDDDRRGS